MNTVKLALAALLALPSLALAEAQAAPTTAEAVEANAPSAPLWIPVHEEAAQPKAMPTLHAQSSPRKQPEKDPVPLSDYVSGSGE